MVVDPLALTVEADHLATVGCRRSLRPARGRPGRAGGHAVPPAREPGPGAGPGRGAARVVRDGRGGDGRLRAGPPVRRAAVRRPDAGRWCSGASSARFAGWLRPLSPLDGAAGRGLRRRVRAGSPRGSRSSTRPMWTALLAAGPCVFEGAQGVLLDEWRGFHPYTTWSTTTFDNVADARRRPDAMRLGRAALLHHPARRRAAGDRGRRAQPRRWSTRTTPPGRGRARSGSGTSTRWPTGTPWRCAAASTGSR